MKSKKICRSISAFLAVLSFLTVNTGWQTFPRTAAAQETVIANPVIWADVPDDDVIRVGDTYYMVSTTMFFSPGAPVMKSKDLVSWEICSYVYDTYADGNKQTLTGGEHDYAHGQWAASLRYKNGVFYVFFGSYGTGKSYIYQTSDIEHGTWKRSELNGMYHDASILFDTDGRNYLVYGGGGEIKIKEFNSEMTGFKQGGAEQTLLKTGLDNLAGEGSHIQKIGDYYYIFLIAWPSNSGRIELCYRSRSLLGKYEGKTVLNSGLGTYGSGVAQGGIVDTPSGDWYAMLFQDHGGVGRTPVLVPVTWQDGWPMMGINGKAPTSLKINTDYTGTSLAHDDDFSYASDKLALEWQWNHNPDNHAWSVTERSGWLRLHNEHIAKSILHARNTLTMRTEGPSCSSVIKLDASHMKEGDCAGLSAFQFNYGNVGVYHGGNTKFIYMAKNSAYGGNSGVMDSSDKVIESVPMQGDTVYLKAEFVFNTFDENFNISNNIDKVNFFYSYDGTQWTKIGDTLSMTYDLKLFTGYRSAVYSYPTKTTGGYADIDFFDYERGEWNLPKVIEPDENGYYFHDTFEGSLSGWTGRGPAKVQTSGRTALDGKEALLVSERTASWNGAIKNLDSTFQSGGTYSFSANVAYFDGGASDKFYLKLQYSDKDGKACYDTIAEGTALRGEWIHLANPEYTIPADAQNIAFYAETADSKNNFYLDEVIVAVGGTEVASKASSGKAVLCGDVNSDGVINIFDLTLAKQGILKGFHDSRAETAADVNQNGSADTDDIQQIKDFIMKKITAFSRTETTAPAVHASTAEYTALCSARMRETEPEQERTEKAGVDYGTVRKVSYYSTTCKRERNFNILLPAGYSENKKYPVLYAMHGYWQNEDTLVSEEDETMKTRQIIGNAIASGEAEDMIVVFPYIYASETQPACSGMDDFNNSAYDNFINELTNDLMPYVESHYSVKTGRENTALTGFSMGGRESLYISMKKPELFGYVGAVCPAPGVSPGLISEADFRFKENAPYLLLLTAGSNDTVVYTTPSGYHEILEKNQVPHIWHYVNGGYHGGNCIRAHLYNFSRFIFK